MNVSRALLAVAASAVLLAGCATPPPPGSGGGDPAPLDGPIAAPGEVIGQGTVYQNGDEPVQFCLGGVMESYPPQCSGPELLGWEWADDEFTESANGVTWGSYAVIGTWDGVAFTATQPPMPLALYDPIMRDLDPRTDPANLGAGTDDELLRMQEELGSWTDATVLTSYPENGYLWVSVYYDDGSIQAYLDAVYGDDLIAVQSVLVDVPA